jgi:Tetratricopeptide repeat
VLGPDHPITLEAAAALTIALVELGEAESARALREDTLQRCRQVYGPDHPIMLRVTQAANIGYPMPSGNAADESPSWSQ